MGTVVLAGILMVSAHARTAAAPPCTSHIRVAQLGDTAIDMAHMMGIPPGRFLAWLGHAPETERQALRRLRPGDALDLCMTVPIGSGDAILRSIQVHREQPAPARVAPATMPGAISVVRLGPGDSLDQALRALDVGRLSRRAALDYAHRYWHLSGRLPARAAISLGYRKASQVLVYVDYLQSGAHRRFWHYRDRQHHYLVDGRRHVLQVMPLRTPVAHARISSGWGWRIQPVLGGHEFHKGIDYAAPKGTPVRAAMAGVVDLRAWHGNYGRLIEIRGDHDMLTRYGHLARYAAGIRVGWRVRRGQVIGYVGSTGLSTGPHLYFELWRHGRRVNPLRGPQLVRLDARAAARGPVLAWLHDVAASQASHAPGG